MKNWAQIKSGIVANTILLEDESLTSTFSEGYDAFIRIDQLSPVPGIGWSYDGSNFTPPDQTNPPGKFVLKSDPTVGGSPDEVVSVPGLLEDDIILSMDQETPGANNLSLIGFDTVVDGAVTIHWGNDPGAGATMNIYIKR